jgi:competence protein ComEC
VVLTSLSLAWCAGLYLGSLFVSPCANLLLALLPLPLLLIPHLRKTALLVSLSLFALTGGCLYYQKDLPHDTVHAFTGPAVVRGTVTAEPEVRDQDTRLRLSASAVETGGAWQKASGTVLLYVPRYPAFRYGDVLEASGSLEAPAVFNDFDYAGYLAHQDVYVTMFSSHPTRVGEGQGNTVLSSIFALRQRLAAVLAGALPEPQASLAQGILLGLQGNIPPAVKADFTASGTTHILAISGLNLTILTGLLTALLIALLGRRHYLYVYFTGMAVWGYALLAGASPSVVRAAIMASIFLLAELSGRQKNAGPALFLAAGLWLPPTRTCCGTPLSSSACWPWPGSSTWGPTCTRSYRASSTGQGSAPLSEA